MYYNLAGIIARSRIAIMISIILFLLIGIIIIAALGAVFVSEQKFKSEANETVGKVIEINKESRTGYGSKGRSYKYDVYVAIVLYHTFDGKEYTCRSKGDENLSYYQIGEKVKVYYDKVNPADSQLDEKEGNWPLIITAIIFGSILIIFPIILWIKRRPFNKAEWEKRRPFYL